MKAKIKALTGKMVRLNYKVNGYDHSMCGKVGKIFRINFVFFVNGGNKIKVRIENVTSVKEL